MRSTSNFQIEPSRFRHKGTFKAFSKSYDSSSGESVPSETEDLSQDVWFSYLTSSGLKMGAELSQQLSEGKWETISSGDKIVFRFLGNVHDAFMGKKDVRLSYDGRDFAVVSLLDVDGESIYHCAGLERIE